MAVELLTQRGQPVIQVRIWSKGKLKTATVDGKDGSVTGVDNR